MLRACKPENGADAPALPLQLAIVHFDPASPVAIDELLREASSQLQDAAQEMAAHEAALCPPITQVASIGSAPRSDLTLA